MMIPGKSLLPPVAMRVTALAAVIALLALDCAATAVHIPSARELAGKSDIVAKVRVLSVKQVSFESTRMPNGDVNEVISFEAQLQTIYVLTGELAPVATLRYQINNSGSLSARVDAGTVRLLFLKQGTDAASFADPVKSALPADPISPVLASQAPTFEERLRGEFLGALDSNDPEVVGASVAALGDLGLTNDETQKVAPFVSSPDRALAGDALVALLKSGHYEYLNDAISYMCGDAPGDSKLISRQCRLKTVLCKITDPAVTVRLIGVMDSPAVDLRFSAAYALRNTKVRGAVPAFVKGLQDSDVEVRYQCLMGLAETVEGEYAPEQGPSRALFDKDETKYIRFWQDWWEREGKQQKW